MPRGYTRNRTDRNHGKIRDQLRDCGFTVVDVAGYPKLGADLIVYDERTGALKFVEIKAEDNPSQLTENELKAQELFPGYWLRVQTLEEVLEQLEKELTP